MDKKIGKVLCVAVVIFSLCCVVWVDYVDCAVKYKSNESIWVNVLGGNPHDSDFESKISQSKLDNINKFTENIGVRIETI